MNQIDMLKRNCGSLVSNRFAKWDELERQMAGKDCKALLGEDFLLLLVPMHEYLYSQLYYHAAGPDALKLALEILDGKHERRISPILCEVIGRAAYIDEICICMRASGFSLRKKLQRMNMELIDDKSNAQVSDESEWATEADTEEIMEMLFEYFDYSERIPEPDEIKRNIRKKQVAVIRRDGRIATMQYFEIEGKSLHGWFVCTRKEYRKSFLYFELVTFVNQYFCDQNMRFNRNFGWRDADNPKIMKLAKMNNEIPEDMWDYIFEKI
jgi:hypothetical protein